MQLPFEFTAPQATPTWAFAGVTVLCQQALRVEQVREMKRREVGSCSLYRLLIKTAVAQRAAWL